MSTEFRWRVVADGGTERWWQEWDRLNVASFGTHPLFDSRAARLLCRHFGGARLRYASLESRAGCAAQLILEPDGFGRWRLFCPSQSGVGLAVFAPDVAGRWQELGRLFRALPGIGFALTLPYQDGPYSWTAQASGKPVHRMTLGTTMTVIADAFDAYWDARPKELRDNLRRRMKRPANDGIAVRLAQVREASLIAAAVDRYADLESAGWKGKEGTAVGRANVQGAFYRELMSDYAASGDARVAELYFDEKLVASRMLVGSASMLVILKTTFDETLKNYSPGHVQLYQLMSELIAERPGRPIEFYTKATRDWLLWATHTRIIETTTIYRSSLLARVAEVRRRKAAAAQAAGAKEEAVST
jgi:hypothetical protein